MLIDELKRHRPLLLMLDFDGTLVEVSASPDAVVIPEKLPELLSELRHNGHEVWIVSGRTRHDLLGFLPHASDWMVGIHGYEWPDSPAFERHPLIEKAAQGAQALAEQYAGLVLEDKTVSVALHHRLAEPDKHALIKQHTENLFKEIISKGKAHFPHESLSILSGKQFVEIRPTAASKKYAVARLMAQYPGHYPVFIGDDVTDEAAFVELGDRGISIHVGHSQPTCAQYRVDSTAAVLELLGMLALTIHSK